MKRCLAAIIALLLVSLSIHPQKVGLVLSGGGAKGLAHIGIIKALEENDIPIDYITGTSMGAIVGALYAMGYTPEEMEHLVKSDDFKKWYTGQIDDKYIYYFKRDRHTPDFFNLKISFKDSTSRKQHLLPTSLVNPVQMNIAFLQVFTAATAQCRGNFDDLFVPFRSVASDVYHKREIIYRNGDLGDAVRASMTFPLVFKPIMNDSTLVYDGGIYNNFPADVMDEDFAPDIIIGSVVASNPKKPDERDIIGQVENMIMQKSDYSLPDSMDILMRFYFTDVSLLDFDKVEKISQIGYDRAISMMDTIKSRITRRVGKAEMDLRRELYKKSLPALVFKDIHVNGATPRQSYYIRREIYNTSKTKGTFTFDDFKTSYFKLLTDGIISEIIPHAVYDEADGCYDLYLDVKMGTPFSIKLGGHISNTSNQVYVGVSYKDLNYYSKEFTLDGQLGKVYNNLQLSAKIDLATAIPTSYRVIASYNSFDYFQRDEMFFKRGTPSINRKTETFIKVKVAFPFMLNKKTEISFGVASQKDTYLQSSVLDFEKMDRDKSSYDLLGGSLFFGGNTLNTKQFATQGCRDELVAQVYAGRERFRSAYSGNEYDFQDKIAWLQLSYKNESYFPLTSHWVLGTYIEGYYSSRNFSHNYTATMLAAGEFAPVAQLKLTYNEDFRANQYLAAGLKPIYKFNDMFHVRGEVYYFQPIFPIERNNLGNAQYGKLFSKYNCFAQLSGVCVLPFAAISAYVNYTRFPANSWSFGITLGWQIFNESFFE